MVWRDEFGSPACTPEEAGWPKGDPRGMVVGPASDDEDGNQRLSMVFAGSSKICKIRVDQLSREPSITGFDRPKFWTDGTDSLGRLLATSAKQADAGDAEAAEETLHQAIDENPTRYEPYFDLGAHYKSCGDHLLAYGCFCSAKERIDADSIAWAACAANTWDARRKASACGAEENIWCRCKACARIPALPDWMASPEALLDTASRATKQLPNGIGALHMQGFAHVANGNFANAVTSYIRCAELVKRNKRAPGEQDECFDLARYERLTEAAQLQADELVRRRAEEVAAELIALEEAEKVAAAKPRQQQQQQGKGKAKGRARKK
jgi:tetratricopeptide (TPR) repeat protein